MNNQKILENIFKKNGISWEIKDFNNYVNPNCKSAESIYSKLTRLYHAADDKTIFDISNSGITDLLRMTIIAEYDEVIPIIQKLKYNFPDLKGYLKYKKSGYRGIHLKFKLDGVPCEIQLAPKIVVMAAEFLHTFHVKWRDFNFTKEREIIKQKEKALLLCNDKKEKNKLKHILKMEKKALKNKLKEEKNDWKLSNNIYRDVFKAANLSFYYDNIVSVINDINQISSKNNNLLSDPKLINIFNINLLTNGKYDKNKVMKIAEQLSNSIEGSQDKFVNLIKGCLLL